MYIEWGNEKSVVQWLFYHTYCGNMEKPGMNPKTLQYLMGYSDIGFMLNTYTYLGLEDATDELKWLEELENARKELEDNKEESPYHRECFGQSIKKEYSASYFGRTVFFIPYTTMGGFMLKYQSGKFFNLRRANSPPLAAQQT